MEWMLKNLDFIWPLKLTLGSQIPSLVTGVGRDLPSPLLVVRRKRGIGGWTHPLSALTLGLPLRKIVSSSSLICLFFLTITINKFTECGAYYLECSATLYSCHGVFTDEMGWDSPLKPIDQSQLACS